MYRGRQSIKHGAVYGFGITQRLVELSSVRLQLSRGITKCSCVTCQSLSRTDQCRETLFKRYGEREENLKVVCLRESLIVKYEEAFDRLLGGLLAVVDSSIQQWFRIFRESPGRLQVTVSFV
jgi:hypothetical protein